MIVKGFEVPYLVEREYMAGVPQEWWLFGGLVRPEAEVTVNGLPLLVEPSLTERGWWTWGAPDAEGGSWSVPLREGENTVIFEALFADGDALTETRTVLIDPTLTGRASLFLSAIDDDPATVRLEVGSYGEPDYTEGASDIGDSETLDVPVADDAVFKLLSIDGWTYHGYDFDGLVELLAFIDDGNCQPCDPNVAEGSGPSLECSDRCIWTSWGYHDPGRYGYLGISSMTTDGELQQFTQAYDP
jgi:hypothetical protein